MRPPDDLDIRLMRELASPTSYRWDVNESFASMAKRLGVDEETVRRRVKRAQQAGLLRGYHLIPNPHLLGFEAAEIDQEVHEEDKKDSAISQIKLIDGVILIVNFHGKAMRVLTYYENEEALSRKARLIGSICGSRDQVIWKDSFPPCDLRLRETDWRIIKSMRKEARRGLSGVSGEVQVSVRTVRRRIGLMTEGNAFFLLPIPGFDKLASVLCNFRVYCPDEKQKMTVDERLKSELERILFSKTSTKGYSMFTVLCNNLAEADHLKSWIEGLEGVEAVRSGFSKELIPVPDWLDEIVDSKINQEYL